MGRREQLKRRILNELAAVERAKRAYPTTRELATTLTASLSSVHDACDELRGHQVIENHAGWGLARIRATATNPDELGGDIAGPGGPWDRDAVVVDTTHAILVDYTTTAMVHGSDGDAASMLIEGRVNLSPRRASVLVLMNADGAAAMVSQLLGLASREGAEFAAEFHRLLKLRLSELP